MLLFSSVSGNASIILLQCWRAHSHWTARWLAVSPNHCCPSLNILTWTLEVWGSGGQVLWLDILPIFCYGKFLILICWTLYCCHQCYFNKKGATNCKVRCFILVHKFSKNKHQAECEGFESLMDNTWCLWPRL